MAHQTKTHPKQIKGCLNHLSNQKIQKVWVNKMISSQTKILKT